MTALIDRYRVPATGLINYRSFCDCVDEVFFDSEKAKNAEAKARSEGVSSTKSNSIIVVFIR